MATMSNIYRNGQRGGVMHANLVRKSLVLGFCLSLSLSPSPSYSQETKTYSFQAFNFPKLYIRHKNFLAYIDEVSNKQAEADAAFRVVPGLAGECNSFEAAKLRGYFLRHQNFRVKLAKATNERQFKEDATFCLKDGLASIKDYSFEAINFPNYFIRHSDFELRLEQHDGSDLFSRDATFIFTKPVSAPVCIDEC